LRLLFLLLQNVFNFQEINSSIGKIWGKAWHDFFCRNRTETKNLFIIAMQQLHLFDIHFSFYMVRWEIEYFILTLLKSWFIQSSNWNRLDQRLAMTREFSQSIIAFFIIIKEIPTRKQYYKTLLYLYCLAYGMLCVTTF
jgi:hypothetical protein